MRKRAVRRRAGLGVSNKRSGVQPYVFLALWFYGFRSSMLMTWLVAPIPASGPATDGRAAQGIHICLDIEIPAK